ncbi:isoaspartyl peptidase/L-asparaginase-like isoform X2 [Ornithodoros turicata]
MPCLPVLVVHGGAARIPQSLESPKHTGLLQALDAGFELLTRPDAETAALDAVEEAVRVLESLPSFNAGYGSSLTVDGRVEMDALVMEGTRGRAGAVGAARRVAHPVTVARRVMEKTEHILLVGDAADQFAAEVGLPLVDNDSLVSDLARKRLEEHKTFNGTVSSTINDKPMEHDTVGAVAVDSRGRVACATSTGGLTGQRKGRVGDTPIVGAGGIADDTLGAVSTTGHGEAIMRACLSKHILFLLQQGLSPQTAVDKSLEYMKHLTKGGCGGAILVTPKGEVAVGFNTVQMAWASRDRNSSHWGLWPGQKDCL